MKMQVPFMQLPLVFDAAALQAEIGAIDESAWRPHPQGYPGNDALTLITVGGDPDSDAAAGPMRPTIHLDRCPYLRQVLDSIGATWGRTRLMRLAGNAEVTPHVDVNYYWRERVRVHVPIVTQPTVRFSCGGAQVNMRAGECWIFDTWRPHHVVNDHDLARIHLVADTVGGARFWEHVRNARPHDRDAPSWSPRLIRPNPAAAPMLEFESENLPAVMTPWEVRSHIAFMFSEANPHPNLQLIHDALIGFTRQWHALWSCHGAQRAGWSHFRRLLDETRAAIVATCATNEVLLRNGIRLIDALDAWVFDAAITDRRNTADPEVRRPTQPERMQGPAAAPAGAIRAASEPTFDRPVFIVSPPRSGSTMLFETLAQSPGLHTIGDESHQLIEGLSVLAPQSRGYESNRLLARDATPDVVAALRRRFFDALRDRNQRPPDSSRSVRMLEKTPKNALRVPFLASVFPEARFIYLHRDVREVLSSMIEAWSSGGFRTYPQLPGWTGPAWSLLLVPGWQQLNGAPLHEIAAAQWRTTTQLLLDDLEQLPADRWTVVRYDALVADPQAEILRLCGLFSLDWDRPFDRVLPLSRYTVTPPAAEKWRRHADVIEAVLPLVEEQRQRAERIASGRR
jgi:hypothetical protein